MTGRSGTNPPEDRPGSRQTAQLAELTASPETHDTYWHYEDVFDADDEDYDGDNDDDPSSVHIEDTITSCPRQLRYYQPSPPRLSSSAYSPRESNNTSSSPIPHARDPMTYNPTPPSRNPPAGSGRRVRIRRGVAREPRAHLSSIPEDSASTAFPYTIQGPQQRIVRPLPPIPAGAGQQEQVRGPPGQRGQQSSEVSDLLPVRRKEKDEGGEAHGEERKNQ